MRKMFFPFTLIILAALLLAACTGGGIPGMQSTAQIPGTGGGGAAQPTEQIPSTGGSGTTGGTTGAETPAAVGTTLPTSGAMTGGTTGAATGEATGMATGAATTPGGATSGGLTATGTVAVPTSNSATSGSGATSGSSATSGSTGASGATGSGATTSTPGTGPVPGGTTGNGGTTGSGGATGSSDATGGGATSGTPAAGMTTGTATTGGSTAGGTTSGGGTTGGGETTGTPSASATTGAATSGGAAASGGTTSGGTSSDATAGTPAATLSGPVPPAGSQPQGLYVRMSELLNASVNTQSSAPVGRVDGLMIERPLIAGVETTSTPNAPTATPVPLTGNQGVYVRYLMVNVTGAQAQSGGSTATNGGSGNEVMVPWGAVASSAAGTVTLNISANAFSSAPHVTMLDVVSGSNAWSSPAVAYWSGQGLSIPNTGSTTSGNATGSSLVFIPRERGGINITDEKDTVLGSVSDLLINPTSGEVIYAIFESGQTFGNRVFVLPMRSLLWVASSAGGSVADRGAFHFNFNSDLLKNAPSLNSLNQLQVSPALINQLNTFWNSAIQALPVVTTTPVP